MVRKMRTCSPCFSLVWKPTMFHKRAERIVLAQLDDRIGPAAGARIVEADRLHRPVAQRFGAALGHHLDRHAALEIGRVLFPVLERLLSPSISAATKSSYCGLVERAVDVVLAALVPARGHPGDVHVDAVAMDDRSDRVEEGEGAFAGFRGDRFGEPRSRSAGPWRRSSGGRAARRPVRAPRVMFGCRSMTRVTSAAKPSRSTASAEPAGTRCLSAGAHDQRAERAHFLVEQSNRIVLGIVGAEAVRADHFGEASVWCAAVVSPLPRISLRAHPQARLGELPRGLRPGEAAADDVDVEWHVRPPNCPTSQPSR